MKWLLRSIGTGLLCGLAIAGCVKSGAAARPAPAAEPAHPPFTPADVHFMSGMIAHHAQAVLIAGWAEYHGANAAVRVLSERIVVAQKDEIALAQRWLDERGQVPMEHTMVMPGMLTREQLAELDRARGPEFDRLYLTLMIQHHEGAVTMVAQLLGVHGAAQDGLVFRFAADVHADQTTEIARMRRMLAALPPGGQSP